METVESLFVTFLLRYESAVLLTKLSYKVKRGKGCNCGRLGHLVDRDNGALKNIVKANLMDLSKKFVVNFKKPLDAISA
ncbi:hypothetical protein TNCT_692941 [Trichonephila clavata]|uniref:Uncharacterized protein n=1 Tax=Trichonephila clavata TaxID=2740835 RepID=A0A8X6LXL6_TRICU|nr:hypothetical protein TNCT_692941 [Trichonephila clavata]